jgi:septal ring factor EnvC (AmiA/AmiB activator)
MAIALVLFALAAATLRATVSDDHPAVKIIALLEKLQAQVKEEGEADTHLYGKFTYWCDETSKKKAAAIKKYEGDISQAETAIEALTADIDSLNKQIKKLDAEITADESARAKAQSIRDEQLATYQKNKSDLESTIQACADAITALKAAMPGSLVQAKKLMSTLKPPKAFLQKADPIESDTADKFESRQGGDATYTSKGGDATEVLKKMHLQYEDDLVAMNKAEADEAAAHTLADSAKKDKIDAATKSRDTKQTVVGEKGQDLSSQQSALQEAQDSLLADKTVLTETTQTCKTRADEYEYNMKTRAKEAEAMQKAVEAMTKVTGVRSPESKGVETVGFLQLSKVDKDPLKRIVAVLKNAGSSKQTAALAKLADKISKMKQTPGSGTFDQIKNMIEKMIFHLMSEQKDEDDHKNWCDKELETTEMMKDDKTKKKGALEASINELNAEIVELGRGIEANQVWIADMEGQIEAQTTARADAKAENAATMKDAEEAQTAISEAIAVLEEFYKSSGEVQKEAWESFAQLKARRSHTTPGETEAPEPALWESKPYTGTEGGAAVIGMLENIATDFASMESAAKADETTQQEEFDTWLTGAQMDKAEKTKDSEMKTSRKERLAEKLDGKSKELDHTADALDSTTKYEENLQHACVDGDSTYAERKAARTQEISALREAEGILDNAFAA